MLILRVRSYVIVTITNPSESLLSELRKVEEMKLQCDEKREVYEDMLVQHKEKKKLRNGKVESSITQKLQEAQDEYDEVTRLCVFRVKSLKEGQCRSLITQGARHHAAQLNFFREGIKALEAVEPLIKNAAVKHHIDYQLSELPTWESHEGEPLSGYESTDNGELSFDYKLKKQGLDDDVTSTNPMELDQADAPYLRASYFEDSMINLNKPKGEQLNSRQTRVSSYSAPLFPENRDTSERLKETQPAQKFHSYVLPPPITRNQISKPPSISHSNSSQNLQYRVPVDHEKHLRRISDTNTSTSAFTSKVQSTIKDTQLPAPTGKFSLSHRDNYNKTDSKAAKQKSYSGPLTPTKQFSFKITSNNSGPITSTELPQPPSWVLVSQPNLTSNVSRSASPPPISSPELHELPRPPNGLAFSKPVAISSGSMGHSAPLLLKNQEISPPNKRPMLTSICVSPLPLPPSVPKNFSIPSSNS
ncbi:uncharacterized protein At2g33490-like isoform X2 [Rutidosis leptorrhynchoides]|uniref:uncharacterized protein At2g33490-like isoform X2 n=1 Tax=Rutidosis leptorrhynchoides TaxID=125765 RepID=UPI003A99A3D1